MRYPPGIFPHGVAASVSQVGTVAGWPGHAEPRTGPHPGVWGYEVQQFFGELNAFHHYLVWCGGAEVWSAQVPSKEPMVLVPTNQQAYWYFTDATQQLRGAQSQMR